MSTGRSRGRSRSTRDLGKPTRFGKKTRVRGSATFEAPCTRTGVPHRPVAYERLPEGMQFFCSTVDSALQQFDLELAQSTSESDTAAPDPWGSFMRHVRDDPYCGLGSELASPRILQRVYAELIAHERHYAPIVGSAILRSEIAALSPDSPPSARSGGPSFVFFVALAYVTSTPIHLLAVSAGQLNLPNTVEPPAAWPAIVSLEGLRRVGDGVTRRRQPASAMRILVTGCFVYALAGPVRASHVLQLRKPGAITGAIDPRLCRHEIRLEVAAVTTEGEDVDGEDEAGAEVAEEVVGDDEVVLGAEVEGGETDDDSSPGTSLAGSDVSDAEGSGANVAGTVKPTPMYAFTCARRLRPAGRF